MKTSGLTIQLDHLLPEQFEELCFDLPTDLGFIEVIWRKGTGGPGSPADAGRELGACRTILPNTSRRDRKRGHSPGFRSRPLELCLKPYESTWLLHHVLGRYPSGAKLARTL